MGAKSKLSAGRAIASVLLLGTVFVTAGIASAGADERRDEHRGEYRDEHRGEYRDEHRGRYRDEHRDERRDWDRHGDREHERRWGGGYYPAPPVIYGQPAYYPPPVVYGPGPGVIFPGFGIGIR